MKNRQVVFVHYSSLPGGIEVILPKVIDHFQQYLFSAFVIRPHTPGKPDVYAGKEINVRYGSESNLRAVLRLFRFVRANRDCIFQCFNIGPFFLLILRFAGVRHLIYSIHGTQYWKNGRQKFILKNLWRCAIRKSYQITSNSVFSGKIFRREVFSGNNISLLYNPVDGNVFNPLAGRASKPVPSKIVYCGRLDKGKNLDGWILVAAEILKVFPETVFEIYGDGPEHESVRNSIDASGHGNSIFLRGYTANPEQVFREADLLLFLSRYESFGNVVVESILCGTPVIAGDIPSMKEIFGNYPEFLVRLDGNVAEAVIQKLKEWDLLNRKCDEARQEFLGRFSPEQHFEKLNALYSHNR